MLKPLAIGSGFPRIPTLSQRVFRDFAVTGRIERRIERIGSTMESDLSNELAFKRWVMARWPGWAQAYEPRLGSSAGIPDLGLLVPRTGLLLPVELKVGYVGRDGKLKVSPVRPAQMVWHKRFGQAGGRALMLVGQVERGKVVRLWTGLLGSSLREVDLQRWVDEVLKEAGCDY